MKIKESVKFEFDNAKDYKLAQIILSNINAFYICVDKNAIIAEKNELIKKPVEIEIDETKIEFE